MSCKPRSRLLSTLVRVGQPRERRLTRSQRCMSSAHRLQGGGTREWCATGVRDAQAASDKPNGCEPALFLENTEGVGERPGRHSRIRLCCRRRGSGYLRSLVPPSICQDGGPQPPSRRRPLSSTGAGGVEARRGALTALRLTPARVTQSTTRSKSKTGSGEYVYFFFRRFVLRAPFFAADFVFVLRFFAMLPS